MSNCDECKHGSRHNALDASNNPIPKNWTIWDDSMGIEMDNDKFWTYIVCKKNTFSIMDICKFFIKGSK